MNSSVNLINMLSGVPNKSIQNNQVINMDNGAFFKLMTMLSDKNQVQQSPQMPTADVSELNIMDLIAGSSFINSTDVSSAVFDFDGEVKSLNEDDNKKDIKFETALANFIMMFNHLNPANEKIDNEKLQPEVIEKLQPEVISANSLSMDLKKPDNFKYEIPNMTEKADASKQLTEIVLEVSPQAKKLVAEIEGKKDNLKSGIDFNFHSALASRESLVHAENKIITISDESSQIKPQVLSQVRDKIAFMAEEGSDSGTKQVTMELHPNNLGKVDIKMTFEDNKITVEIKALNEETQKILSSGVGELTKILNKTTESSINVVVKNSEIHHDNQTYNYNQNNEQRYGENYDQQNGQGRQKNYYYKEDNKENSDEDSIFSELINLRNIKFQA